MIPRIAPSCWSSRPSSSESFFISWACDATICRSLMKVSAILTLISTARRLLRTLASITTPCSVKASGGGPEPVTNWPQFTPLLLGQLEHEGRRESAGVAPDLPVQILGFHPVELREVAVDHHALASDQEYAVGNGWLRDGLRQGWIHSMLPILYIRLRARKVPLRQAGLCIIGS